MIDHPTTGDGGDLGGLLIEPFVLGPFETNCYVVRGGGNPACLIVDAGFDPGEMIGHIERHGLEPRSLVLTHAHADHIAGVREVRERWAELPILIHDEEREWLVDPDLNLSASMGFGVTAPGATGSLVEGERVSIGGYSFAIVHTPGHSPGGVSLYCAAAGAVIVGDALFNGSIGRTDFPGSDFETLAASIRAKLYTLPDETVVHPGHGSATTIGREKRSNPFVRPAG
jgi:glyoxylase-like metal-dependent hydrolase (beta-lactamase superfamily II)